MEVFVGLYLVALLLALYRIARGPTFADRLVALDSATGVTVVLLVYLSLSGFGAIYLDIAIVLALTSILGTISIAALVPPEEGSRRK